MKKLFMLIFGLGFGLIVGFLFFKRMDQAAQSVAPGNLAGQAGKAAGTAATRLRAAWEETKSVAAQREEELRTQFNVPRAADILGDLAPPPR